MKMGMLDGKTAFITGSPLDEEADLYLSVGNPLRAVLNRDPYPFYARLRAHSPVYQAPDGRWLITGYNECLQMMQDRGTSHGIPPERQTLAYRVFHGSMLYQNPPVHTRLRGTVSALFTPRAVGVLRERVADISRSLLAPLRDADEFDFRLGPAFQLPVIVIADMLNIPPEDFAETHVWADVHRFLAEHEPTAAELDKANAAAEDAVDYFSPIIEQRRRHPGEDLISRLIIAEEALTVEEIVAMCVIMHTGGHSTTQDLLSNGVYHLSKFPESAAALRADVNLIPTTIEEILRFDTPVGATLERITTTEIEIGDQVVPPGQVIHAILAAANRDPKWFPEPDKFDITRIDNRHLAFAAGIHVCIGAHLSRLEGQEFMRVLTQEYPPLEIAGDPDELEWGDSYIHRGLKNLPVRWNHAN
jgi:pimeloyl-[acyl-carrier protein] synthase